ncbi:MAG: alpha-L-fucosidase [Akkermansiaceae bacterium]|nr:alpha-L-fucosidase [Akkermansiaceae bacterium]
MKKLIYPLLAAAIASLTVYAGGGKLAPDLKTHPEAIEEFQDWRFGMFIHWGPVALKGTEIGWSRGRQIPVKEYDNLYKNFNPEKFDADAWARTAKEAGMKYLVLTTKHHDGFCLWPTQQRPWISATEQRETPYSIAGTPFKRDICKELSEACKKHGIAFCTYYSVADWYHYDWTPRYHDKRPTEGADMDRYVEYMNAQCAELIKNYDTKLLWFDGEWFNTWTPERGAKLYRFLRSQKDHLVINNRVGKGRKGMGGKGWDPAVHSGDYDTPEQHIGAYNENPWETCMTICRQWAWKPNDKMKSAKQCIQSLIRTNGGNGNFLFNVGPMPDGRIEPRQVERLKEMGTWIKQYGESIYGTRGGPFLPSNQVLSTRKGNKIFIHMLDNCKSVTLPMSKSLIKTSKVMTGGSATIDSVRGRDTTTITLGGDATREIAAVVELTLTRSAMDLEPEKFFSWAKSAKASNVYKNEAQYAADKAVDGDPATRWATDEKTSETTLTVEFSTEQHVANVHISEVYQRIEQWELDLMVNGAWKTVIQGTKIGATFTQSFPGQNATAARLRIIKASDGPSLSEIHFGQ